MKTEKQILEQIQIYKNEIAGFKKYKSELEAEFKKGVKTFMHAEELHKRINSVDDRIHEVMEKIDILEWVLEGDEDFYE